MNKKIFLLLGAVMGASGLLIFFTLTRGHLWGDDFAGYLLQTKSILLWNMPDFIKHSNFTISNSAYPPGPVAYPWGFPLLLAPIYFILGLNPLALKLVNLFAYLIFLYLVWMLARTRLDNQKSLFVTAFFAFCPVLISANDLILSDLPFLALSTFSLWLMEKRFKGKLIDGLAIGISIFLASFFRSNGILLLAPLAILILIEDGRNWRASLGKFLPPLLTLSALYAVQSSIFPNGQGSYFSHFSLFTPQRLLDNILYYLWLPSSLFDRIPGGMFLYLILLPFWIVSGKVHFRRDAAYHVYGLLTILLFIIWPERQGLRFIYPVLPFLLISVLDGMQIVVDRLKAAWHRPAQLFLVGFWLVLLCVFFGLSTANAVSITAGGREINGPFDQYSYQMYEFVRKDTLASDVMIFRKPRALRLFTGRDSFMSDHCEDLSRGNYVILSLKVEDNGQIAPEKITSCNPPISLNEVFRNKRFVVFKIN